MDNSQPSNSNQSPYPIGIPPQVCSRAPYTPEIDTNTVDVKTYVQELENFGRFLSPVIVRPITDGFEVVSGWHLVKIFESWSLGKPNSLMPAMVYPYSNAEAFYQGFYQFQLSHRIHKLALADALMKTKQAYRVSGKELGSWLSGAFKTSTINNLLRLTKLSRQARLFYQAGRFEYSVAKLLSAKSMAAQDEILLGFSTKRVITYADVGNIKNKLAPYQLDQTHETLPSKSFELKKLEISLSELLGCPTSVNQLANSTYSIELLAFSSTELVGVAESLQQKLTNSQTMNNASIRLSFNSMLDLNQFLDKIMPEND